MYPYQQHLTYASCLRKTSTILLLILLCLLSALAHPGRLSADDKQSDQDDPAQLINDGWSDDDASDYRGDDHHPPANTPPGNKGSGTGTSNNPSGTNPPGQGGGNNPGGSGGSGNSGGSGKSGGSGNSGGSSGNSKGGAGSASGSAYAANSRPGYACPHLSPRVQVRTQTSGVHCRFVSGAGIGIQSVIDQKPIDAVDIWSPPGVRAEVCFAAMGKILFLDATTSPRRQQSLPATYAGGHTCASISNIGIVILLPGAPDQVAEEQTETPAAESPRRNNQVFLIEDAVEGAVSLTNCRVSARFNLNVRVEPAGQLTGLISAGQTEAALARTENWFKVLLDDAERWISAHFVNMRGSCQLESDIGASEEPRTGERDRRNAEFLIEDAVESAVSLADCSITARQNLNVRMEPAGQRTGRISSGSTLTALARTENWFMIMFDGAERWVSAHFVDMSGDCQYQ